CLFPKYQSMESCFVLLKAGGCSRRQEGRIIGGYPCLPHSQNWQAFLRGTFICGGVLIAPSWVVTAAHCFGGQGLTGKKPYNILVHLGKHNLNTRGKGQQIRRVAQYFCHPQYDRSTFNNDIMLLKLRRPVSISPTVAPLGLPSACSAPGTTCIVSGWGTVTTPKGMNLRSFAPGVPAPSDSPYTRLPLMQSNPATRQGERAAQGHGFRMP
uniref:Peptidase S1 domain-containing protein n=1 Tax=Varanus komodoensis TaxID=61221 RepID=A0A8D2L0I2_VARKO